MARLTRNVHSSMVPRALIIFFALSLHFMREFLHNVKSDSNRRDVNESCVFVLHDVCYIA